MTTPNIEMLGCEHPSMSIGWWSAVMLTLPSGAENPAAFRQALFGAVPHDADAFRAYLASRSCLLLGDVPMAA
ncbi:MAG TPA: hypothetical protein VMA77_25515 [Solirubrobacteraceae bacterium]|nr:hypothetical protein [Solirubrobacteraceae bacterium]